MKVPPRWPPVGECIYCGSLADLTDEHVVPYALGGDLVLPKSSCRSCAAITGTVEQRVLRGFMRDARTVAGLPTRRPRERPKALPLKVRRSGDLEALQLPPREHPGFLLLPLLSPPAALHGGSSVVGVKVMGYELVYFGKDPVEVAQQQGATALEFSENWDVTAFARMLAKIGYAFAASTVGLASCRSADILPVILGVTDTASAWVGSAEFSLNVEEQRPTHALGVKWISDPNAADSRLLVVQIKLFAPSGATGYLVVVKRERLS